MRWQPIALVVAAFALGQRAASALPPDPAARGLDLFVHAPDGAAAGGEITVQLRAFGFATATRGAPLGGATVEAAWDPETVAPAIAPSVKVTTDAFGAASVSVRMPEGKVGASADLLVAVRHGGHARTKTITLHRKERATLQVFTSESRAVPGSTVPAWVRVTDAASGRPLPGAAVDVALREADVARQTVRITSDRGGMGVAMLHVPLVDEPGFSWTVTAEGLGAHASTHLGAREETPGTPSFGVEIATPVGGARPGDKIPFVVRLRDASGKPVARHATRYWIGVGAPPKEDDAWNAASRPLTTDLAGEASATIDTPTVVKATGVTLNVVARTEIEGKGLDASSSLGVARGAASVELSPEAGDIIPGVTQKMQVQVTDARGEPARGEFTVRGDGLEARITTDEHGTAEVTWRVPAGLGANRNVGPCAGGVAAAIVVAPTTDMPALGDRRDGMTTCVSVDRDADAIVRVTPQIARPGEKVRVEIESATPRARAFSVIARPAGSHQSTGAWLRSDTGTLTAGEIALPKDAAGGKWTVSAAPADASAESRTIRGAFVVTPEILANLSLTRTGGRATPGGHVEITAKLTDRAGRPLVGTVSGVMIDAHGGGHLSLSSIDALENLCRALDAPDRATCGAMLDRRPEAERLVRAALGHGRGAALAPSHDPGANAKRDLDKTFAEVVKSLEGAVLESTESPDRLKDARRKGPAGWAFNPELMTLVTAALPEPPHTPGGEEISLADLVAIDPQVTFDHVARRVTRLKLFRVLLALRNARRDIDRDEPALKDPNALLRKLVREGTLTQSALLDPWGGTMGFVRTNGPPTPFIGVSHGFELHAPGPDGRLGTADDVRDPFERVLRSGTPYANAVEEDRLVDARLDMRVADATVDAWSSTIEELTGSKLGGLGLTGVGEGGGGRGTGIGLGHGSGYGHGATGRASRGIVTGNARWVKPTRTDDKGEVKLRIPLGDVETTWRLGLMGVPDGAAPATSMLDIASDLPISAKVEAGARWTDGDDGEVRVSVRNRTKAATRARLSLDARGACALRDGVAGGRARELPLDVSASTEVPVGIVARGAGECTLVAEVSAPGQPTDVLRHSWEIAPRGQPRVVTAAAWTDGALDLETPLDAGYALMGTPRLVLERGYVEPLAAALDSLEPERAPDRASLLDVMETARRVSRWAATRDSARGRSLGAIAAAMELRALGRYRALARDDEGEGSRDVATARLLALGHGKPVKVLPCPEHGSGDPRLLDLEPPPSGAVPPCWGALVTDTLGALERSKDGPSIALGVLAAMDRPHRMQNARVLADHLRRTVALRNSGEISGTLDRPARALVYAALLRAGLVGTPTATPEILFAQLARLRDATGGYGSPAASAAVARALLASQLAGKGASRVSLRGPGTPREIVVPEDGFTTVALATDARSVHVDVAGPGLVVRLERPALRAFSHPPPSAASPVEVEIVWPADAEAGKVGTLRLVLKQSRGAREGVDTRIPLPPGVELASGGTRGVHQMQGNLLVRWSAPSTGTFVDIPVRFGLRGRFSTREASSHLTADGVSVAIAPARTLVVR